MALKKMGSDDAVGCVYSPQKVPILITRNVSSINVFTDFDGCKLIEVVN